MFKSEFQIDSLRAEVATAEKFGSVRPFLLRVQADCEAELASIAIASKQSEYAAQFCPARAAEVYTALAWINLALGFYVECPAAYGPCTRSPEGTCYACGANPRRDKFTVLTTISL